MHKSNRLFWEFCKKVYPLYFQGNIVVIEYGSYNINGSVRDFFDPVKTYIGVDWRPGPGVDLVSLAHEVRLEEKFDTVISASLLEHDPYWKLSLENMIFHLKQDGLLVLSWGAARNKPHCFKEAPDGQFHALKAELVFRYLESSGIYIHNFFYEGLHYSQITQDCISKGMGEVGIVAFKDKNLAIGPRCIDSFLPEDTI